MSRRSMAVAAVCIVAFLSAPCHSETQPAAAPVVRALEAHYRGVKTLKAVFLQRYSEGPQSIQAESGTVYFSRPGQMRWEYESPEKELFVSDGKTQWDYVPADHTVTRSPAKESTDWRTPLALLTGKAKLAQLCERIELSNQPPGKPGNVILRCIPRGEKIPKNSGANATAGDAADDETPQFTQALLEVNPTTGELADVRILQPGDIEMDFRFGDWEENLPLPQSLFHFEAPKGVAIVNGPEDPASTP